MKKIITLLTIVLIANSINSQTAAYYCSDTGAVGYCYGYSNVLTCAYDSAITHGATNPKLLLNAPAKGYGALAVGVNEYGITVVGISAGYNNADDARRIAYNQCVSHGGTSVYIKDSWLDW